MYVKHSVLSKAAGGSWQTCRRRVPAKLDAAPDERIDDRNQSIAKAKGVDEPGGCPQRPANDLDGISRTLEKTRNDSLVVPTPSRAHQFQAIDHK